jgi:nicotinate-nucleotide adenylyltransferase
MDRQGKSFAYDTIRQFQVESAPQTEFYFIVGADSMLDIMTWYRGGELFEVCRFVAASRPGFDLEKAKTRLTEALIARVVWLEVPGLHIASRDLRSRVQRGEPIRYLVPDGVAEHIAHLGLYQGKDEEHHRQSNLTGN